MWEADSTTDLKCRYYLEQIAIWKPEGRANLKATSGEPTKSSVLLSGAMSEKQVGEKTASPNICLPICAVL